MSASSAPASALPWWKEPTKDQWYAYCAAWMGWTLDAFDFTVFLLIMAPIAQEFGVPLIEVTAIFTVTLIMRLGGATASGWLADRLGRRAPLMISILWYSVCNLAAGLSPSFTFLFVVRALAGHRDGRGMAGRRGAGDGILARPLARLHVRRAARLVGPGLRAVGAGLRLPVLAARSLAPGLWLARHADPGRAAGLGLRLDPHLRERAGGLDGEQEDPEHDQEAGHASAVRDLQAQISVEHLHGLSVDGGEFLRLLRDLGHARHLPAKGAGLDTGPGGGPGILGQHPDLSRLQLLGRDVGKGSAGAGRS